MENDIAKIIAALLASQQLAVLATSRQGQPYTSLVAFDFSADLRRLTFATTRATRKFANLRAEPRVSLLIDNRSHRSDDFRKAMAVSAFGCAAEMTGANRTVVVENYLRRHPGLQEFVTAPSCALLQVTVEHYALVRRFQDVVEWDLGP